jgi:hypothetical protein
MLGKATRLTTAKKRMGVIIGGMRRGTTIMREFANVSQIIMKMLLVMKRVHLGHVDLLPRSQSNLSKPHIQIVGWDPQDDYEVVLHPSALWGVILKTLVPS